MSDKPEVKIVNLTKTHTIMWYCLLVWVMLTSMFAGAALYSGGHSTLAVFALLGNIVLGATMATISRREDLE